MSLQGPSLPAQHLQPICKAALRNTRLLVTPVGERKATAAAVHKQQQQKKNAGSALPRWLIRADTRQRGSVHRVRGRLKCRFIILTNILRFFSFKGTVHRKVKATSAVPGINSKESTGKSLVMSHELAAQDEDQTWLAAV